jgi:hypothetical protein
MDNYLFFILLGLIFFIMHYLYLYRLNKYLSINYPTLWEKLCQIPIIPNKLLPYLKEPSVGFNYLKVMKFIFSSDLSDDKQVFKTKKKVKPFFFLYIISWAIAFVVP